MDISGDGRRLAVGVPGAPQLGFEVGAVYALTDFGTPQQREHILLPSIAIPNRRLGTSLAMSANGHVLVSGAPGWMFGSPGLAFVFRYNGRTWDEEFVVSSLWPDEIGFSVEVSDDGNLIVVGAPSRSPWANYVPGAVEVYRRSAGNWVHEATVFPTDQIYSYRVGLSISLSGDGKVLAMRAKAAVSSIQSSSIYIYENVGNSWVQRAKLFDPTGLPNASFGMALELDQRGELLAAGDTANSQLFYKQGAVHLFRRTGSLWAYESTLYPSAASINGYFGTSIALNSPTDRMLVGAPGQLYAGIYSGVVEEFELTAGGWQARGVHAGPSPSFDSLFGRVVAMSATGGAWVTAEPLADQFGPDFGAVHLYEATCLTPQVYCTAQTNTLGCLPAIEAQGTPSVSSSSGFRIAARNVRNRQNGMLIYGTSGRAALPWLGGTLCVAAPLRRTPLVNSGGSLAPANDCSGALVRDFNAWAFASNDPELFAGQHVRAQFYSRDPGAQANLNLSDAVEFYLEP